MNIFESIRHINEYDAEYWSARELMPHLGYENWQNFEVAITRAKESCKNAGQDPNEHFLLAPVKSTGGRPGTDYTLSRYACYLIAQNGDPRKEEIALAQNYFVIQTRRQEKSQELIEDHKRVLLREEMKKHNHSSEYHKIKNAWDNPALGNHVRQTENPSSHNRAHQRR